VIDDLVSSGESKLEAIAQLVSAGLMVEDIAVLIDREGGGQEKLANAGYRLHSVLKLSELIDQWEKTKKISSEQAREVRKFLGKEGNLDEVNGSTGQSVDA
jgi:uridine monophosphate synthetase